MEMWDQEFVDLVEPWRRVGGWNQPSCLSWPCTGYDKLCFVPALLPVQTQEGSGLVKPGIKRVTQYRRYLSRWHSDSSVRFCEVKASSPAARPDKLSGDAGQPNR